MQLLLLMLLLMLPLPLLVPVMFLVLIAVCDRRSRLGRPAFGIQFLLCLLIINTLGQLRQLPPAW